TQPWRLAFPYTTLFRSHPGPRSGLDAAIVSPSIRGPQERVTKQGQRPRFCHYRHVACARGSDGSSPRRTISADGERRRKWLLSRSEEHTSELQSRFDLV